MGGDWCCEFKRCLLLGRKAITNLGNILKSIDITLPTKVQSYSQRYGFSSSHVQMWELDHKEGRALKNWCFWTVVLEKPLESPLDSKEIKPINPKGYQHWIFIVMTDAEAPTFWPPNVKSQLIGKAPDAGKDWRQEEKEVTEDEMCRWLTNSMHMSLIKLWEILKDRGAWCTAVHGSQRVEHNLVTEQQQKWIPWCWRFPIACEKVIFIEMKLGKSVTIPDNNYWISVWCQELL